MSNSKNTKGQNKTQASLVKSDDTGKAKRTEHDGLFKLVMCDKIAATEFLEEYLPANIKPLIDMSTIKVEKESYVHESLKKSFSDVVISVKMKNDARDNALVYTLCEHQSSCDYWMSLRIFEYIIQLCKRHVKGKKRGKLPLIVPIIIYNGIEKYNAPRNIYDLFINPKMAKEILTNDHQVINVNAMSDEEIKSKDHLGMFLYMIKHIYDGNIIKMLQDFLEFFEHEHLAIDKKNGYTYLKRFLFYIQSKIKPREEVKISNILENYLSKQDGTNIMETLADVYEKKFYNQWIERERPKFMAQGIEKGRKQGIEKGRKQGIEKGIEKGREEGMNKRNLEIIKNMLSKNYSISDISDLTGLSSPDIEKLKDS